MIQWVYESAALVFDRLVVATDDRRIHDAVKAFGGEAIMTSTMHRSGTERCGEALNIYSRRLGVSFSHVVNIQGDEPLIKKEQLLLLKECFMDRGTEIATLIRSSDDPAELQDPNVVKVVTDKSFKALYFSRSPIPYLRESRPDRTTENRFFIHIGLYGYRSEILEKIVKLSPTPLEVSESLEQLRWLEHGFHIQTRVTPYLTRGVDTPEDLEAISSMI